MKIETVYILIAEFRDNTMAVVTHWHHLPSDVERDEMEKDFLRGERAIFTLVEAPARHVHPEAARKPEATR